MRMVTITWTWNGTPYTHTMPDGKAAVLFVINLRDNGGARNIHFRSHR